MNSDPDLILPTVSLLGGFACFAGAMILAYCAQQARDCIRVAIYAVMSAMSTLGGAAIIFGHLVCHLLPR